MKVGVQASLTSELLIIKKQLMEFTWGRLHNKTIKRTQRYYS